MVTRQGPEAFVVLLCAKQIADRKIGSYFCVLKSSGRDQELLDKVLAKPNIKSVPIMKTCSKVLKLALPGWLSG